MEEIAVKVAVRIRPLLPKEILHNHQVCVRVVPNTQQVVIGKDRAFTFDFVFGQKSSQEDIYSACVKPLVISVIEGYNATVFAYGQTGSGKTYTIGGGHIASFSDELKGIIPRAIHEIFQNITENHNVDFDVKVSYIEVYKEELRDLLELQSTSKDIHIREDEKGNTVIIGAKECEVETPDEMMSLLEAGNAARHTGTTQMNEHSSRSHAIFTMYLNQKRPKNEQQSNTDEEHIIKESIRSFQLISSKFCFVDLAGSERVTKTGNTGERFKESIQINSGLLALGNVISALGDPKRKSIHIPYRDTKITRLLKDSLGGNAKTVMIACISPSSSSFDESLNTLKYANRAKDIRNKPIVNYNPDWDRIDEMELQIKTLREALQNQQTSLLTRASQVSQDLFQDKKRIHSLEEQVAHLQMESYHYKHCIDEALHFFLEFRDENSLKENQWQKLKEWFNMVEELQNELPDLFGTDSGVGSGGQDSHHITIFQLKRELKKCQDALATDEELFGLKAAELKDALGHIQALEQEKEEYLAALTESQERCRIQNDKIVEQQLVMDQLQEELQLLKTEKVSIHSRGSEEVPLAVTTARRPHSVPLLKIHLKSFNVIQSNQATPCTDSRKVHTSPPSYALDRVVASFRTRSQMLVDHLEEHDEVIRHKLDDDSDDEEVGKKKENINIQLPRHPINQTWTQKQANVINDTKLLKKNFTMDNQGQGDNKTELDSEKAPQLKSSSEADRLRQSQVLNMKKLKTADMDVAHSKQKIRELAINIRMKEELIKELVKTGQDAQAVNRQYYQKITQLEQEAEQAKTELSEAQKQLQELENKELRDAAEKIKLQKEFRKKMETAKVKMQTLQRKQQETRKLFSLSAQSEKRLVQLSQNVENMKQQQQLLHKKLQEESEKKRKLENEIQRDQQLIKELELKREQQQKILKKKAGEITHLKKTKCSPIISQEQQRIDEQRKWLDEEVEKILQQRQALAELEEDLRKREVIVDKKEALLKEKNQLEMKRLRSSQALNKDILNLSTRLNTIERELSDKSTQLQNSTTEERKTISQEMQVLQRERAQLLKRRHYLDEKLELGNVLSPEEERILFQLEEGIEALDAAIEYKNETINCRQHSLRASDGSLTQNEANVMFRLGALSAAETRVLLCRYFNKVVSLRETERTLQVQCAEMSVKITEQENVVHELESAVERLSMEIDRRLTLQQKEHEQKMQLVLQYFKDRSGDGPADGIKAYESKIQQLEKDLYFYKKTSRELKKKLRELVESLNQNQHMAASKNNGTGNTVLSSGGAEVYIKEQKWASRPSKNDEEENTSPPAIPGIHKNQKSLEEISEMANVSTKMTHEQEYSFSSETTDEAQLSNALTSSFKPSRLIEKTSQLHVITPVRLSRKELRQITATQVSMRRPSFSNSVNSIPTDSTEINRKSVDFNK
ncbi:kinesin-like protein KIF27 isoform X1 [Rhincodon typus]|uniref:kinesin-like protein KIF27 isoform X1 n=1 Tax=Rhincodon typus TaxID=259920 RepID=UPI00202DC8B4|nr:kinesin-like protein KIF27 isoform X1 [Rhincodon typus]XP_048448849.1 kinesin-like protein KIF27 isoform X1 [Rhincodon typus]